MNKKNKTKPNILALLFLTAFALPCLGQQRGSLLTAKLDSEKGVWLEPVGNGSQRKFEIGLEIFQELDIAAKRDGFLADANLAPGTIVSKGQVLVTLDVSRLQLDAKRLRAEILALEQEAANNAELVRAEQDIKVSSLRNQELTKASQHTRIPRIEIVEAMTNLEASRAAVEGLMVKKEEVRYRRDAKVAELEIVELEIRQSTIIAPFDGIIFKQHKHIGEAVSTTEPLAEIYRLDYLLGTVLLQQNEIAPQEFVNVSGRVTFELPQKGVETFEFEKPKTLPRVERDGRYLAVIKIRNRKTERGNGWELLPGMRGSLITDKQMRE